MESQKISRFAIIDENKDSALAFKIILMNQQFQNITLVDDPTEAIETIERKRIQFVLIAWENEIVSGAALVQRLASKRHLKHLPVLIYSSNMSEEEENLVRELNLPFIIKYPIENEGELINLLLQMITDEENLDPLEHRMRQVEGHFEEGQYDLAINEVTQLLEHVAYKVRGFTLLGETYLQQTIYPKAEESFNEALAIENNHTQALQSMAKIYQKTSRGTEAISLLTKMNAESPYNIETLLSLGINYVEVEDYEKAKKVFNKIKEIDPENQDASDELGKIAFREGDYSKAKELLSGTHNGEEVIRHFNNIAIGMVSRGDYQVGVQTYETAISLMQDAKHLHILQYNLGLAYRKAGELKKAFNTLLICSEDNPTFEKSYAALVRVIKEMQEKGIEFDEARAKNLKKLRTECSASGRLF